MRDNVKWQKPTSTTPAKTERQQHDDAMAKNKGVTTTRWCSGGELDSGSDATVQWQRGKECTTREYAARK